MKRRKQNYHLKTGITRRKKKNTKKNPHTKLRWKKRDFRPCRLCGKAQTKISENRPAARRGLTKRWKFKRLIQNYLYGHNVNLSSYYLFVTYSLISLKALQTITQVLQFLPRTIAALQAPAQLRSLPARPRPGGLTEAAAEPSPPQSHLPASWGLGSSQAAGTKRCNLTAFCWSSRVFSGAFPLAVLLRGAARAPRPRRQWGHVPAPQQPHGRLHNLARDAVFPPWGITSVSEVKLLCLSPRIRCIITEPQLSRSLLNYTCSHSCNLRANASLDLIFIFLRFNTLIFFHPFGTQRGTFCHSSESHRSTAHRQWWRYCRTNCTDTAQNQKSWRGWKKVAFR